MSRGCSALDAGRLPEVARDGVRVGARGSVETDGEVDLGVVIGARTRYLAGADAARGVIGGYLVFHDVSEREFPRVNGVERRNGTTADMVRPGLEVVRYLGHVMVLDPGDLVDTGTPAGAALGRPGTPYPRAGDVVGMEIDGLGRQRQAVGQA